MATDPDVGSRSSTILIIFAVIAGVGVLVLMLGRGSNDESSGEAVAPPPMPNTSLSVEQPGSFAERTLEEPVTEIIEGGLEAETPSVASQRRESTGSASAPGFGVVFDESITGRERQRLVEDLARQARSARQPEMPPELRRAIDEGTINTIPPEFEEALRHQPSPPPEIRAAVERGDTMPVPPPHIQKQFDDASRRIREQGRSSSGE
jgi:hypothetical protein